MAEPLSSTITVYGSNHVYALPNANIPTRCPFDAIFPELTSIEKIYQVILPENRFSIDARVLEDGFAIKKITIHTNKLSTEERQTRQIFLRFATKPLVGHMENEGWADGYITF